jgi:hypothetical protein
MTKKQFSVKIVKKIEITLGSLMDHPVYTIK